MLNSEIKQPVLLITGMHRSGTSFITSLLESAGLDIGKKLVEPNFANPKGYFENTDFLKLHESILYSVGINSIGWTLERNISPPQYYVDQAKLLIKQNESIVSPWGWKDPRTSLFLPFWSSLLPEAKYIFIYRSPWEVIDSLFRRADDIFSHYPEFALKIWMNYNQAILDYYLSLPDRCLLINLSSIIDGNVSIVDVIKEKFGIILNTPNMDLYDSSLLVRNPYDSHRQSIIKHYFPDAFNLYCQLNEIAKFQEKFSLEYGESEFSPSWILQDWLKLRQSDRIVAWKIEYVQSELQQSKTQLEQTQIELQQSKTQLEQTQIELQQSKTQLEQTQIELQQTSDIIK